MRSRRGASFDDFYSELEDEARIEGPEAILDLRAKELKYALINTLITKRQQLNLTQQMLAKQSGVAQTEISRIERGRKSPTLDTFSRLASALRIALRPIAIRGLERRTIGQAQGMIVFGTARRAAVKKATPKAAGRGASRKTAGRKAANASTSRAADIRS